jgi:hypothetical protein
MTDLTPEQRDRPVRPVASTHYSATIEVECVQVCGWKPGRQASSEAVRHVKATGHETAVKHHSSIHYHVRREP